MHYFVCDVCNAKRFVPGKTSVCPRCGDRVTSAEQMDPPWRTEHARRQDDNGRHSVLPRTIVKELN
jgi:ribosomal protein S27AE